MGILTPLQKPGKKRGPSANLWPIILLSIIRKILALCLMERILNKIMKHVPSSQSAYQQWRSTTEQVFTLKLLAEEAVTLADYNAFILLMDMSKAFDTVIRKTLLEGLRKILNPDELHIIKILIEQVELSVRIGKTTGEPFTTSVGIPKVTVYPQNYSSFTLQKPWNMSQPSKIIATMNLDISQSQNQ